MRSLLVPALVHELDDRVWWPARLRSPARLASERVTWTRDALARTVDHTLLKPEATDAQVAALVADAAELGAFSVCVSPSRLPLQVAAGLAVCTVVGFPSGAHAQRRSRPPRPARAVGDGAIEVDMVVDLGRVLAGDWDAVERDVAAVKAACGDVLLKVILETAALTDEQVVEACRRSEAGGAQYVKTSTGFHPSGGASVGAVRLMRETVGDRLGVKASGGIRDTATALAMLDAGASRLGLSGTRAVLDGLPDVTGLSRVRRPSPGTSTGTTGDGHDHDPDADSHPAPHSRRDRCDRCGAQAFYRAVLASGELLFCAHHGREHADRLAAVALEVQDGTEALG